MCQKNKNLRNHGTNSKVSKVYYRIVFMDDKYKVLYKHEYDSYELAYARFRSYMESPFDLKIKIMVLQKYRISKYGIVDMHIF